MKPLKATMGMIVAACAATLIGCPDLKAEAAEPRPIVVEITKFTFVPRDLVVGPGDVVVWRNLDIVPHSVTSKDGRWDSGTIEAQGEWQTTMTDDMAGEYLCRFHPSMAATLELGSE